MSTITEIPKKTTWTTWEELLLAFSVKRHGLRDWDSVAMELRSRSFFPALLTAQICKEKYCDLHRRFTNNDAIVDDDDGGGGGGIVIPWLEELRQLRVAELRQEVHRQDLSIQSLQSKVKRMEEEREKERQGSAMKPDLEENRKENSENDEKHGGGRGNPVEIAGKVASGGTSGHENRSVNESNSVENRGAGEKCEPDPVHGDEAKPDRLNASNTSHENKCDDVSKDERKEGSDVESSASLMKKRRRRGDAAAIGGEKVAALSPAIATKRAGAEKSEPLVRLLDNIRSNKHGSLFNRRLKVQKTYKYKSIIRQHVDLETVESRINDGYYSSCPTKFYVDLLLLFNNAIVFFPKSSPESVAAHELCRIVTKELKITNKPNNVQPKPDSLLAKCNSTSSVGDETGPNAPREDDKLKMKERPVTRVRSMRRTSKCRPNHSQLPAKKQTGDATDEDQVATKAEKKKKKEEVISTYKKRGAADFLERIKKSSPMKETTAKKSPPPSDNGGRRKQPKRKAVETKDKPPVVVRRQNGGGSGKDESFPTKKSIGRPRRRGSDSTTSDKLVKEKENIHKDDYSKRPKKRSKR